MFFKRIRGKQWLFGVAFAVCSTPALASFNVSAASAVPASISRGQTVTLTAQVHSSTAASNMIVDLELYNSAGTKIGQLISDKQTFGAGQSAQYTWKYPLPVTASAGQFTLKVGVFSSAWSSLALWDNSAASFALSSSTAAAVNGVCGAANGQSLSSAPTTTRCASGTASATSGSGPWTWQCSGAGGGTTASCSAKLAVSNTSQVEAPPTGLVASAGDSKVSLNWAAAQGASSYFVKRALSSAGAYTLIASTSSPAYTNANLMNGVKYFYMVSANGAKGRSANSSEVSATPLARSGQAAPPPVTPPVSPPASSPPAGSNACAGLLAAGVWQHISPSGADLSSFGITHVNLVPTNPAVVYVGTSNSGIFKSTNCGGNFVKINTGTLGAAIDPGGTNPTPDPVTPNVVYTFSLYGMNGFFKSTDGGVNFKQVLTPNITQYAPYGGFSGGYDIDPQNHLHLLVSWHDVCAAPYNASCFAETLDGGVTWTMRNGLSSWDGGEGTTLSFLDSNRWLFSSATNGLWLTKDQGKTWNQIPNAQVAHGTGQLIRMSDGSFFMAGANGILFSPNGETWSLLPNSGNLDMGLATDGSTVWTSVAFPYNTDSRPAPAQRYFQTSVANHSTWSPVSGAPSLSSGGCWLAYDPVNHILYSANYWDGLWRVVIK